MPETLESSDLNLRTKSLWLVAAIAVAVLGIALLLVGKLVAVANDRELALQIGWNLLFIALSAGDLPRPRHPGHGARQPATSRAPAAAAR